MVRRFTHMATVENQFPKGRDSDPPKAGAARRPLLPVSISHGDEHLPADYIDVIRHPGMTGPPHACYHPVSDAPHGAFPSRRGTRIQCVSESPGTSRNHRFRVAKHPLPPVPSRRAKASASERIVEIFPTPRHPPTYPDRSERSERRAEIFRGRSTLWRTDPVTSSNHRRNLTRERPPDPPRSGPSIRSGAPSSYPRAPAAPVRDTSRSH